MAIVMMFFFVFVFFFVFLFCFFLGGGGGGGWGGGGEVILVDYELNFVAGDWSQSTSLWIIMKTCLFKYIEIFFHQKKWGEAVLTSTHNLYFWAELSSHNLCFWAEIRKIMYTPENPSFTI